MKRNSFLFGTCSVATRIWRCAIIIVGLFVMLQFVSLYLSWQKQMVLGGASVLMALVLHRVSKSHVATLCLMIVSLIATLRYGWWRFHTMFQFFADESNNRFTIDSFLMVVLLSAEAYTFLIMILGFMQTSAPLRRKPIPLPADEDLWPHVDVLIPSYNEPLSLVRYTALAAINIDYPPNKLHVYILDDGTRDSFRDFANAAGIGYITRSVHDHAKAGNINHALSRMNSELVTIFDCDHVPTRSFLQVTVGWFLAQKNLAMLQTPHHFYSPDPFERNLLRYQTIPNEGELFYGIIQDGNDLWNATFFCGSCAVIRRAALDEVGGIATETVTEDAHTSLRLQKKGWNTAYINLAQAAGLATETLAAHVGQRVRWARGMIQILRTDNPLLASGMKFTQRLCYFNAMLHFMYAVPRLIFLCAPLLYMLAGRTIIPGYWLAILAYAMPHLVISSLTNSRVQGRYRHSFWNEIYETVLAPYILLPTLLALVNPKLGTFNVTDKGNTLNETRYDRHIAAPTTFLLALNFLGVCLAPYRLLITDSDHPGTVISNLAWILFNMVILGVAAAVAHEHKQLRRSVRIPVHIPVRIRLTDGVELSCITHNMSVGGASLKLSDRLGVTLGDSLHISFPMQTGHALVAARVVGLSDDTLRVEFPDPDLDQQETITRALYSRANSWITSRDAEVDRPMRSLGRVIRLSFTGFNQTFRSFLPAKWASESSRDAVVTIATILLFAISLCGLRAEAQASDSQFPGVAMPVDALAAKAKAQGSPTTAALSSSPASEPKRPAVTLYTPETPTVTETNANFGVTFKDLGVQEFIPMHGPHSIYSLGFVLEHSRIPTHATLNLTYHFSSLLLPHTGSIKVRLNETPIAEIAAPGEAQHDGEYASVTLPLPVDRLVRSNELTFEFTGSTLLPLESNARSVALANIGASSRVLIAGEPIPFKADLSMLPLPIFDPDLQTTSNITFVFPTLPSYGTLQAAGIVASWLGILTTSHPIHYSVSIGKIPNGNVIIFNNTAAGLPAALGTVRPGPSLSLRTNPNDPQGNALVLSGDDEDELLATARSLALMTVSTSPDSSQHLGDSVSIADFPLPSPRQPDDAPRWLQTDQLTSLWTLSSGLALQSDGSRPLPIYFRVPPDLNYGETQNLDLKLSYRYNATPLAAGSAMRVFVNGQMLHEVPVLPDADDSDKQRTLVLPVAAMRPFGNTLLFNFDFIPKNSRADRQGPLNSLSGEILKQSYLDIRGIAHRAKMPDLELFANAGFPFTRRADLAETVIVMPVAPTPEEIELLLNLMSHFGTQTGYPVLRVEVDGPGAVMRGDRDYLILGGVADQPGFESLAAHLPVTLSSDGIEVRARSGVQSRLLALRQFILAHFWPSFEPALDPSNDGGAPDLVMQEIESPFFAGRSIVTIALRDNEAVERFSSAFFPRSQSSDIAHSVSLLRNGTFKSFTMSTDEYHVGDIPRYSLMRLWLAENFWFLFAITSILCLPLACYTRDYLRFLSEARLQER